MCCLCCLGIGIGGFLRISRLAWRETGFQVDDSGAHAEPGTSGRLLAFETIRLGFRVDEGSS